MVRGKGPDVVRFFRPLVEVLREIGGSGRSAEVVDLVIERMNIPESEQAAILKSGQSRVYNQVHWARLHLIKVGLLRSSERGVWTLTEKGRNAELTDDFMMECFREARRRAKQEKEERGAQAEVGEEDEEAEDETDVVSTEPGDYQTRLLNTLKSLPPGGFEQICQLLLREAGFQQVTVTGRTGDGGIDGHGVLQVKPLLSFKVLFQCKRYQGTVAVSVVRDFRGALQGRADKGIILTTGTFTTEAKREAIRDGATPVELVDGDKLVEMFEELGLGLVPRKDFDIDDDFFDEYR